MALNWDTTKVKYFKENPDELWKTYGVGTKEEYEDVNAETKSLIFGTMAVGIGNLTISNAGDFYARWKILEKYDDFYLCSKYVEEEGDFRRFYLTPDVVIKHINLNTNVSNSKKKEWIERYVKNISNDRNRSEKPTVGQVTKYYDEMKKEFEESF